MGNLNFNTTPEQLSEFLAPAGEIVDVYFATDRETGRPRGFAFVTFAEDSHAAAAIQKFNGSELDGRALNINEAKERPHRPGGPRPGGPRPGGPRPGGPRPGGPREHRPRFEDSSFRGGGGGGRSEGGVVAGPDDVAYDPTVEKGFDDRDHENEYEDGGGGGRNRGRKAKKTRKGSRRGLRARKRSL